MLRYHFDCRPLRAECGGHEPRVLHLEARDGLPPAAHPLGLQRRPPTRGREVGRARGRPGVRLHPVVIHHVRREPPVAGRDPERDTGPSQASIAYKAVDNTESQGVWI